MRLAFVACALLLLSPGCTTPPPEPTTSSPPAPSGPQYGVNLSPRSYGGDDFSRFFDEAREVGTLLGHGGDWADLGREASAFHVVAQVGRQRGLEPFIHANVFHASNGTLIRPFDEAQRQRYLEMAVNFARDERPPFLGLGMEINILWEKDPATFDAFAAWWPSVYDAVKAASPSTQVFPIFQYERLIGLRGGLFGGTNGTGQWPLLERFPRRDATGFTTYPGFVYSDPSQLPPAYYEAIAENVAGPVVFSEVGWFADAPAPGWESSTEEQARFVSWFFDHAPEAAASLWLMLYDQASAPAPAKNMGLVQPDGPPREAWHAWRQGAGLS